VRIKTGKDKGKAIALKDTAITTLQRLRETNRAKYPSNSLKDYYDIIKSLMEALNALEGIKFKGDAAHYKTIEHICRRYALSEPARELLQQIRDYRNMMSYEGFHVKSSYIKQNVKRIEKIIKKLLSLLEDNLRNN